RKGSVQIADTDESEEDVLLPGSASESSVEIVSVEGRRTARCAARVLRSVAEVLRESEAELGELDAVAGDGDHGRGMTRGSSVALAAAEAEAERGSPASVLAAAGGAWAAKAGGTSGALWGAALRSFGQQLPSDRAPAAADITAAAEAARAAVQRLGGAQPGDKTLVDALVPFVEQLQRAVDNGTGVADAWRQAADAAAKAARATADLRPRTGRARPLAERSLGTPDPGAVSLALVLNRIGDVLAAEDEK